MLYETTNDTLRAFLLDRVPEYIENVPDHWLDEHVLSINIQVYVAMVFLVICIPGNLGHLLVFIAYTRLDWKYNFYNQNIIIWHIFLIFDAYIQCVKPMRHFRARRLHTASNRLLISLLSADFILLINCYMNVYQGIVGAPVLGTIGNKNMIYTK